MEKGPTISREMARGRERTRVAQMAAVMGSPRKIRGSVKVSQAEALWRVDSQMVGEVVADADQEVDDEDPDPQVEQVAEVALGQSPGEGVAGEGEEEGEGAQGERRLDQDAEEVEGDQDEGEKEGQRREEPQEAATGLRKLAIPSQVENIWKKRSTPWPRMADGERPEAPVRSSARKEKPSSSVPEPEGGGDEEAPEEGEDDELADQLAPEVAACR